MSTAIPVDALLASVKPITNTDLTQTVIGGNGLFDVLMTAFSAHLNTQLEKGRISGNDYATVYLGGVQACMQNAIQYLTTRDQAYAQALATAAQIRASEAQVTLAEQELLLKQTEQQIQLVNLDITRQQLEIAKVDLTLKQAQLPLTQAQTAQVTAQTSAISTKTPLESALLTRQAEQVGQAVLQSKAQTTLISQQVQESIATVTSTNAQISLLNQKRETEIAQTADNLSNGAAVGGIVASQKALQAQQASAFQRDAEQKAAKILMDTWTTRKTVDDGVAVPSSIDTAYIDSVMKNLYARANLA